MPIPVAKLQEAQDRVRPLSERILQFLRDNPTQAFTTFEIYGGVQGLSESALAVFVMILLTRKSKGGRLDEVQTTLQTLEQQDLIQSAKHLNTNYYAIRQ